MPRVDPIQESFTSGEISPRLWGRPSLEKYRDGLGTCENFLVQPHGPANKRGGTRFVLEVKTSADTTIVQAFNYQDEYQYILEFGDNYIRFFRNQAVVLDGASPYELTTTYGKAEVEDLRFEQDESELYIFHKDHIPAKLVRIAHDEWALRDLNEDGIDTVTNITHGGDHTNDTYTGVALGGGTGSGAEATVVVSGNDVTRVTITDTGTGYLEADAGLTIDNVTIGGAADATVDVDDAIMMNTPAAWGAANYPTFGFFFELRLFMAATPDEPNWVWSSNSSEYNEFTLGTAQDNEGLALPIKQATKLLWATTGDVILLGAHNGEFRLSSNSLSESLTPDNIRPSRATNYGSSFTPAVQIDADTIFVQRGKRKIRRLQYSWQTSSYKAEPLTLVSEHITESGIEEIAYSNEPDSFVWGRRTDGVLVAMTYEPDSKVFGWHRHPVGGTTSVVKSIAVVDGATQAHKDEIWMVVSRTVNSATVQYVEYLTPEGLYIDDAKEDAYFVDCGLTATGSDLAAMTLTHLEGETVRVLADGAVQSDKVVTSGEIVISPVADKVQAGLAYDATLETLPIEGGNPIGTSQTKIKRIVKMALRLYRSLTFYYGDTLGGDLDVYPFGPSEGMGDAISLYTGDTQAQPFPSNHDTQGRIKILSQDPLPLTILAIVYELRTKD